MRRTWMVWLAAVMSTALFLAACETEDAAPGEAPDEDLEVPEEPEEPDEPGAEDEAVDEPDDADEAAAPDGDPIVIGGAFSVTDWMAAYDGPPREGATVAVEYLNEEGGVLGRPLELVESDSQSDPAVAAQAALELIDQGADVLIAPCDFDVGAPVGIEGQRAGIPAVSTCATSPGFPDAVGDMMFMVAYGNNRQAAAMAEWAVDEQGWTTAHLIVDQSIDYTRTLGEYFETRFTELGGEIVGEDSYQFGDEDFSSQISNYEALDEEPDLIYVASLVPDIGTILRQFRAAGIDTPVASGDGIEADLLVEVAGADAANNTFFTTHGYVGGDDEQTQLFVERYEERYGEPPETSFHAIGWDTVMVIAEAIEDAGTDDPTAIRDAMQNIEGLESVTGQTISYSPENHVPEKNVAIIEVVDGEFELITWWDPEEIPPAS